MGRGGSAVGRSELGQGDIAWPLGGSATDFAGSWIQDYLLGAGTDEAGGTSAATMADPERNFAFQLLPGKTAEWLRFTFTVDDPLLDVTLDHAQVVLREADGDIKVGVLMHRLDIAKEYAVERLSRTKGHLRDALEL